MEASGVVAVRGQMAGGRLCEPGTTRSEEGVVIVLCVSFYGWGMVVWGWLLLGVETVGWVGG